MESPARPVAVSRNGRLVLTRGYGYADKEAKGPVAPDALFRIASLSKPITSVTIMKLVEDGKLNLDAKALDILSQLKPTPGAQVDSRFGQVSIRQLLWHSGGWDRDKPVGFDPMFRPAETARDMGTSAPHSCETIIRWKMASKSISIPAHAASTQISDTASGADGDRTNAHRWYISFPARPRRSEILRLSGSCPAQRRSWRESPRTG